jgi:hypothetical protein
VIDKSEIGWGEFWGRGFLVKGSLIRRRTVRLSRCFRYWLKFLKELAKNLGRHVNLVETSWGLQIIDEV